jgi:outer membrane receptor protein involved in Fe transport
MSKFNSKWAVSVLALLGMLGNGHAHAQGAATPSAPKTEADDEIIVVGSNIRGKVTQAVPVTVLSAKDLEAIAVVNGDDLVRSIPQIGEVNFNPSNSAQTTNAARGDVGSIDLRSLGVGNTLVLVNGRRIVNHPSSQALVNTGSVPVLTYNTNAIPTTGLGRLEVLLDGGAALYGTDAVAGVVNTVMRSNFDGLRTSLQYGGAEGTSLRELQVSAYGGKDFERGNISFSFEYNDREALRSEDQNFTSTGDLRPLFAGTSHADVTTSDTRNTRGLWPNLQTPAANGVIRQGTTALTSSAGAFHIRPTSFGSCTITLSNGTCIRNVALQTTGAFRDLRYDTARGVSVIPEVQRFNLFVTGHYDLSANLEVFGELGYYSADTLRLQPPVINLNPLWIPASNYWNPLGPVTFADGRTNPNRLPGLSNVPASGLPIRLDNYRFVDAGFQKVDVENYQSRFLVGLRGKTLGFEWNSALVYSEAEAADVSNNVSSTLLQRQLALSTPDAYNPFNGGCIATPSFGDCTPSSQAAIDAITFQLRRDTRTTLTMADLRVSRGDLFKTWAGDVGVAFGAEVRKETQRDNRDPRVDGTIVFTDAVTGEITGSDAAAVSPNPDAYGERTVGAAYLEFAVPIVSKAMKVPLVHNLELQLAGRYENYSDFGDVAKPKVAMAWDVVDGFRVRASYSEGFRAPNLEQLNVPLVTRNSTGQDLIRCEADLRARRITSFAVCGNNLNFSRRVAGNPNLDPEESVNKSVGIVFQPKFLPTALGDLTFTADRWKIDQEGLVGILGTDVSIALDYQARLNGGSNPEVTRAPANADDVAFFAGTGLAPAGRIVSVNDRFINLLPQSIEGMDFGLIWEFDDTPIGDLNVRVNATQLTTFERDPGPVVGSLLAARAAGQINAATPLPSSSNLLRSDGRPEWRWSASLTWSRGPFQIGTFTQFIGDANETAFLNAEGRPWKIASQLTHNVYGQVEFDDRGPLLDDTRIRVGVRNITDEKPPLTSEGYNGFMHRPYGRYFYINIAKSF